MFNTTLIISDKAGFESFCFVAALRSVTHRVGKTSELSSCKQIIVKMISIRMAMILMMMVMMFLTMMITRMMHKKCQPAATGEKGSQSALFAWIRVNLRLPGSSAAHFGHKFCSKRKCKTFLSSLLENKKGELWFTETIVWLFFSVGWFRLFIPLSIVYC